MTLEICRICGTTENLKYIFSEGNDELLEQIRLCANIQIDIYDCLPKFVCNECKHGLEFSYRLRKRGEETEKKLRHDLLLTSIEPYSMVNESIIINTEENNLMEEFCDEEIWIKDDNDSAVNFSEHDILIEDVSNSEEYLTILPPEEHLDDVNDEPWIDGEEDEILSAIVETEESLENSFNPQGVEQTQEEEEEYLKEDTIYNMQTEVQLEKEPEVLPKSEFSKKNKFECKVCYKRFEKKSEEIEHAKIHAKKRFHCAVCDKWFSYRYRYDEHIQNHFSISERAYPCVICHKSYTNQGNMERHIRSVHNQERKFQCDQCGASFGRSDILKMHMAKHTDQRSIECEICKKGFKTNQSLHYHMRIHEKRQIRSKKPRRPKTKPNSKPSTQVFLCEHCDKISHHRTTHMNHMRTHTGEKPFKCSTCDKPFRTNHARTNHQLLHTDKRPHTCQECGVSFRQISHLKSHMLTHTGDKRHVCDVCQKAFAMRSNLVVHLRIHTGVMPYACNKCPKKFLLYSQFKRHKIIHVGGGEESTTCGAAESCIENEEDIVEIEGGYHDSQISLCIDEIIEGTTPQDEDIIIDY